MELTVLLFLSLWFCQLHVLSHAVKIFLIGDSVDRYTTEDWCQSIGLNNGLAEDNYWADGTLNYGGGKGGQVACYYCKEKDTNDTASFVHHFGSKAVGPYMHNIQDSPQDMFISTTTRIKHAMELFYNTFGAPDRIIYHSVLWDIGALHQKHAEAEEVRDSEYWNTTADLFRANLNARLDDISTLAELIFNGKNGTQINIDIGLRTAVYHQQSYSQNHKIGGLLMEFNSIVRSTALNRSVTFYDINNDVWAVARWNITRQESLLRDSFHPSPIFCARAAEKMLSRIYSSYYTFRGEMTPETPRVWLGQGPKPLRETVIFLIQESIPTFPSIIKNSHRRHLDGLEGHRSHLRLLDDLEAHRLYLVIHPANSPSFRCGGVTRKLLEMLHFGAGDVYHASKAELDFIPLAAPIPPQFPNPSMFLNSTLGVMFVVREGSIRILPKKTDADTITVLGLSASSSNLNEDLITFLFKFIPLGTPIPDIYRNGSLVRMVYERACYAVLNGQRRAIGSIDVMMKNDWDFSDVVVLQANQVKDFELIPLGAPLDS
jgi:hypothetical protein